MEACPTRDQKISGLGDGDGAGVGLRTPARKTKQGAGIQGVGESIVRNLHEPVLVLDAGLRAVMANPSFCALMQVPPEAVAGQRVDQLLVTDPDEVDLRAFFAPLSRGKDRSGPLSAACVLPNGEPLYLELSVCRIQGSNGEAPDLLLVELGNVTKTKDHEAQIEELNEALERRAEDLEAANKELEAFTYSVSHDLRTPLRFVNKIANLLLRDHADQMPSEALQRVEMVIEGTRQMGCLIEELLVLSRVTGQPLVRQAVDMGALVQEALHDLQDEQEGRKIEIKIGRLPACQADPGLLKQALLNLLGNALKFTRPRTPARIEIGCKRMRGEKVYFVKDNGVGFDMASADTLFVVFQRFHQPEEFEGTGVGLTLVKRIVERHGGRVWADAEVGQGATFYFTIGEHNSPQV